MLRHNLLIIYRGLRRFKRTFVINLVGLSTGLACALLIYLWVADELSVDKFHQNDEQLYQVMTNVQENNGWRTVVDTPGPLAQTLSEEMPEIAYAAAVAPPNWRGFDCFILTVDKQNIKAAGEYAGRDYFNIFSYPLIQGDAGQVLKDKHSIVISDELAMKLFGTSQDIVGKTIGVNHEEEYVVSGVFKTVPAASSTRFDFVLSFEKYLDIASHYKTWNNFGPHTYVVLREGTNIESFNAKTLQNCSPRATPQSLCPTGHTGPVDRVAYGYASNSKSIRRKSNRVPEAGIREVPISLYPDHSKSPE